ncbi:MAG: hypothetical protein K9K86_06930 [Pseudomonadales bacterium]|nr:hypothetical protein [Pseudomonadales bacterium]
MAHEDGYHAAIVPFMGLAIIEELSSIKTGVEDPFLPIFAGQCGRELLGHQEEVITQAEALIEKIPS